MTMSTWLPKATMKKMSMRSILLQPRLGKVCNFGPGSTKCVRTLNFTSQIDNSSCLQTPMTVSPDVPLEIVMQIFKRMGYVILRCVREMTV